MMGNYGYGFGAGFMMLMPLLWIILIGLIIWAVVRFTQQSSGPNPHPGQRRESPQEILDRRLAAGEIDSAAYDEALNRLTGRRSP